MVRRALVLAAAAALGGCTVVGPDYHVPDAAMVKAPAAQGAFQSIGAATTQEPLPDHWWRLYENPTLDRLIEQAFAANTDLRVAEANLERSLALLDQRNAGREIQGSANAETSWAQRSSQSASWSPSRRRSTNTCANWTTPTSASVSPLSPI